MNGTSTACPSQPALADFGLGRLSGAGAETISVHLEACSTCRSFVAGVARDGSVERPRQAQELAQAPSHSGDSVSLSPGETPPVASAQRRDAPEPETPPLAPPELTDHPDYEILKELGRGGMGVVYLARNRMMDRLEVLKVVNRSLLDVPGSLERFQQEIRSAAKLSHPHIVAAYSVLRPGDLLVFAMEYVEGRDLLQAVKKRGPLPVINAAFYAQQVALGLQHAHEKGMVHRDIKPNNLMLAVANKKHVVKILDFGLAKASSEERLDGALTKTGQMMGTPDYIAPEQMLDAQSADIRADIYSLGCTLYFLLCGRPPFSGSSLYEILRSHHSVTAMPLDDLRADVPKALAAVVGRMMAKQPTDRYQTPAEVARALEPFFKVGVAPQSVGPSQSSFPALAPIGTALKSLPPASVDVGQPLLSPGQTLTIAPTINAVPRSAKRAPPRIPRSMLIAAGAAGFALIIALGVWVSVRNKGGNEIAKVQVPQGGSVVVQTDGPSPSSSAAPSSTPIVAGSKPTATPSTNVGRSIALATPTNTSTQGVVSPANVAGATSLPPSAANSSPPARAVAPFDSAQARAHQAAWADHFGTKVETTNSIGMKMVVIPAGEFQMGTTDEQLESANKMFVSGDRTSLRRNEYPPRPVVLNRPFSMSATEVTVGQFRKFTAATGFKTAAEVLADRLATNPRPNIPGLPQRLPYPTYLTNARSDDFPVERVTFEDAAMFCAWLSEKENRTYRLPTEAEWEFACRAGTTTQFFFGEDHADLGRYGWYQKTSSGGIQPVGKLLPNPFGLFDMYGNSSEWCDGIEGGSQPVAGESRVPSGQTIHSRGGSNYSFSVFCRSAYRSPIIYTAPMQPTENSPGSFSGYGFRCVLDLTVARSATVAKLVWSNAASSPPVVKPVVTATPAVSSPDASYDPKEARAGQDAWAKYLGAEVAEKDSLGMSMVLIPPGEFLMGSTDAEVTSVVETAKLFDEHAGSIRQFENNERPRHRVTITKPFRIGATEVTVGQFKKFADTTGFKTVAETYVEDRMRESGVSKPIGIFYTFRSFHGTPVENERPVAHITWDEAVAYCRWHSEQQKAVYRLPTEAEWEYACRAGTLGKYSFGDDYALISRHACHNITSGGSRVGSHLPNPFGLFDMHGNLQEWCSDYFVADYYQVSPQLDPTGPTSGESRVLRGGFWNGRAFVCRSAARIGTRQVSWSINMGFRCVRELEMPSKSATPPQAFVSSALKTVSP